VSGITKIFIRLARVVFYVAMVPLVLFAAGLMALQTEPVREMAIGFIEDAIAENTRAVCRIEKLRGSLISRFEIDGFRLESSDTGHLLLSAEKVMASYSIPMLLSRTIWINKLNIEGARVNLVEAGDGAWNFEALGPEEQGNAVSPEAAPRKSGLQGFKIKIRRLEIKNSDVSLAQPSDNGEDICCFKEINCSARLDIGEEMAADIRHLAVQVSAPELNINDVAGSVRFEPEKNRLLFDDLRIIGAQSDFTMNGLVAILSSGPDTPVLDTVFLDLSADIAKMSLGEFGRALPISMPDSDVVSGDIAARGPVSTMD